MAKALEKRTTKPVKHKPRAKTAEEKACSPAVRARAARTSGKDMGYQVKIAKEICERLMEGEQLSTVCAIPGMPPVRTVYAWARDPDLEFGEMFSLACEVAHAKMADDIVKLADDCGEDKGSQSKAALRIETRKWLLSKLSPLFADKNRTEITGRNGGPITVAYKDMTDIELAREVAFMLYKPRPVLGAAANVIDVDPDGSE